MNAAKSLSASDIADLIEVYAGPVAVPKNFRIISDTSDFFKLDYNDVVLLGDNAYWLKRYEIKMAQAIKFLHDHGEKHGDIRRGHIFWDHERGRYRWIDFDYNYLHGESMFAFDLQR